MRTELAPEWTDQAFVMPNEDTLANAVEGVAPVEPSRPLRVEPPKTPMSFEQWQAVISDNFPAYARPAEICASVFAQLLLNDVANPFALCLVDVPSSGKTITGSFLVLLHLCSETMIRIRPSCWWITSSSSPRKSSGGLALRWAARAPPAAALLPA